MEVYCLNDAANLSIPADIREQFHRDENGRILFFTAPPLDPLPAPREGAAAGHSIRYLAARARRQEALRAKRKREADEAETTPKKAKLRAGEDEARQRIEDLTRRAGEVLQRQMAEGTELEFRAMYGAGWQEAMERHLDRLRGVQTEVGERNRVLEENERARREREMVPLVGKGVLLDEVA